MPSCDGWMSIYEPTVFPLTKESLASCHSKASKQPTKTIYHLELKANPALNVCHLE